MGTICPLCGGFECEENLQNVSKMTVYNCKTERVTFSISDSALKVSDTVFEFKMKNLIYEHFLQHKDNYKDFQYYYKIDQDDVVESSGVNLARIPYPKTLNERVDRVLLNLSIKYPSYGDFIKEDANFLRAFFCEGNDKKEARHFGRLMSDLNVLNRRNETSTAFYISPQGWQRIEDIQRRTILQKKAFIAMSFSENLSEIRSAIKKGVSNAGFIPIIMDEQEHNHQIVPEMLYEIRNSRFLVMDATEQNYGAYYEAGYALGQGKDIIICCNKKRLKKGVHFDVAQQSLIVWENEDELAEKLQRRIESTIIEGGD